MNHGEPPAPKGEQRLVRPLLGSVAISVAGDGAFIAAAPLLAASFTSEPVAIAAVSAAFYVPWLLVGLPAGALADRWPRRTVMVVADLVRAALTAGLTLLVIAGWATVPILIATVLLVGMAQCFFDAASQAVIPALVGRDKHMLSQINGRYWALDTTGRALIGPPIGSFTFTASKALPFGIDAVSFLLSALLIRRLPHLRPNGSPSPILASVREGMAHLLRSRDLRVLAMAMGVFNFGYFVAMATFVLYTKQILGLGDAAYGLLLAAMAVGGIAAASNAARLTRRLAYRKVQALGMLVQALVWLGVAAASTNAVVVAVLFVVYGAAASLTSVAVASARQEYTPDELIGRVVSAFRLVGVGSAGLGALTGGLIADTYGLTAVFFVAAAALVVAALPTWPRHVA